jgi:ribosomal protein L24E
MITLMFFPLFFPVCCHVFVHVLSPVHGRLEVIDFGTQYTTQTHSKEFVIENRGRQPRKLVWTLEFLGELGDAGVGCAGMHLAKWLGTSRNQW